MSLNATTLEGIGTPLLITVKDEAAAYQAGAAIATLSVEVVSAAEPVGEVVVLTRVAADSPNFAGGIGFERPYEETGATRQIATNGKLAVYAEGGIATDSITATYGVLSKAATYAEPSSTVTGRVYVATQATSRAAVELLGPQGFDRKTASRADGSYAFHDVPPGTYTLVVAVNGAVQQTRTVQVQ